MKILAIEKEMPGVVWENRGEILAKEALTVYNLYLKGLVREIYFTENKIAILILECESINQASELLNTLPLVKEGIIRFDISEMRPYTGFNRIIKS